MKAEKRQVIELKSYQREYTLFSLCGLNCGLCPMHHIDKPSSRCPGCGGEGFQKCQIVACAQNRGGIEYCYLCEKYPCQKYDGIDAFDSFISHRNQLKDFEKAKTIGIDAYQAELKEKTEILQELLKNYNDGRKKTFFCTAVNLLELRDIKDVMKQITDEIKANDPIKEKAGIAVRLFQTMADKRNIMLKLNKKK